MSKIQVNEIVNHFDTGAPDCPKGLTVTGFTTFSGGVSIGGTLTYEDVTNIDSVGVITARNAIVISEDNAIHFRGTTADDADAILRASAGGGQLLINSRNDAIINIDSNNDSTDAHFAVAHGAATGSSTELLRVQENGRMGQGTSSPNSNLHVKGGSESTDNLLLTLQSDGVANDGSLSTGLRLINSTSDSSIHGGEVRAIRTSASAAALTLSTYNGSSITEALRITSDQKVGIGSDNPDAFLVVQGNSNDSTNPSIRLKDGSDTREVSITNNSGDFIVFTHGIDNSPHGQIKIFESGIIDFGTGGSGSGSIASRIRINGDGGMNVGNGVISSASGDGNIVVDEGIYIGTFNGDNQIRSDSSGSGSSTLFIGNASIQVSSDRRLKENIVDTVVDASEELKKVRVVDFTWNDPSDKSFNNKNARGTWTGVIAQELVDVFPFAVNAPRKEEDLSIDHESEKTWMLNQDQLVPVLIKGFQQALTRIESLEAQVSELQGN